LKLDFVKGQAMESEELRGVFDFSQLKGLLDLRIAARWTRFDRLSHQLNQLWCPINCFDKLPPSLERIKLSPDDGEIELDQLAVKILARASLTDKALPSSLRHLYCKTVYPHERPFTKDEQAREDRLRRGIHQWMTSLSLHQLTYKQLSHRFRFMEGRARTLKTMQSEPLIGADHLGTKLYDLTEETWRYWYNR